MTEHFQIAIIGSGPGGYVAALKAAQMGASVAVIEKHYLGGTCLNYGCIPSKALLASAELMHKINHAGPLGVNINGSVSFDWPKIQQRKDKVVAKLRGGIKGLFDSGNVRLYQAKAKFAANGKLQLLDKNGQSQQITADNIIIASGSIPARIGGWNTKWCYFVLGRRSIFDFSMPPGDEHDTLLTLTILYLIKYQYPEHFGLK